MGVVLAETLRGATLTAERRETPENVDLAKRALLAVVSCSWSEAKEAARPAVAAMAAMGMGMAMATEGLAGIATETNENPSDTIPRLC